jgi:N utilization substance protein B
MARRSRSREIALQVLYQDDLNELQSADETERFLRTRCGSDELTQFAASLVSGVRRNRSELDALLDATAENWSLNRMAATDRNVLRLGAFEIIYTDTPGRVSINEAIELAKRYGTNNSAHFVNGILDKLLQAHGSEDAAE